MDEDLNAPPPTLWSFQLSILRQLTSILNRNCIFKDIRRECTSSRNRTHEPTYCMHNMLLIHTNSDESSILRNRCCGGTCGIVSHGASQSHTGEASDVERAERKGGERVIEPPRSQRNFILLKRSSPNARRNKGMAAPRGTEGRAARGESSSRKFKGIKRRRCVSRRPL